jgi:ERCC4-type nuclease
MSFLLDNRERELVSLCAGMPVKTLPVGDIWVGLSGEEILPGGIVFERKTIADMEASMSDGRYREQRTRLQAFAQEKGCHLAYIFEGNFDASYRFSKPVLWKWIMRLPFVHKIPYFQTKSVEETAEFLKVFAAKWQDDKKDFVEGKTTTYTSTIKSHTKGEQRDDPHNFAVSVLTCCKGISAATAEGILKACGNSLTTVWNTSEKELAVIQISEKRKLGPAVAKKLYGLLHSTEHP